MGLGKPISLPFLRSGGSYIQLPRLLARSLFSPRQIDPLGALSSVQGAPSSSGSDGGGSVSGWAAGVIGVCAVVAALALVVAAVTHHRRKHGKRFLAEQMEEDGEA
jgi:hypothetical protein